MIDMDLDPHRQALFGLCYRMLGSVADAEDLVQDTFRRALERPPPDRDAPLRPWLVTVATRLCLDALRRRRREGYFGPWLPAPVELEAVIADFAPGPEARYGAAESASYALLVAMETLPPRQRAALVLRDVLGLTGPQTAAVLEVSPDNARALLSRARRALADHREAPIAGAPPPTRIAETPRGGPLRGEGGREEALRRLVDALGRGDAPAVVALLADDVVAVSDGGGEYIAAVRPIRGRDAVLRFYANLAASGRAPASVDLRPLNGQAALVLRYPPRRRYAPRAVVLARFDRAGRVDRLWTVMSVRKLLGVTFEGESP